MIVSSYTLTAFSFPSSTSRPLHRLLIYLIHSCTNIRSYAKIIPNIGRESLAYQNENNSLADIEQENRKRKQTFLDDALEIDRWGKLEAIFAKKFRA